jgi:hypothetical protein
MESLDVLLMFGFAWLAGVVWFNHFVSVLSTNEMLCQQQDRWLMLLTPLGCALGLFWVLSTLGDPYVRSDFYYLAFYWLWGMAWLAAGKWLMPFLGFSVRDDGLERRNTAGTIAICGAFIGITASFAGGNIGEGPGWWVVLLCVVTSTGSLFLGWFVLEFATQISETITIERNFAAGVRLAALLIIMGLILGNSVSGNWVDMQDFVESFGVRAWYVIPLVIIGIGIEWAARPSVNKPRPSSILYGLLPALGYCVFLVLAASVVLKRIPE